MRLLPQPSSQTSVLPVKPNGLLALVRYCAAVAHELTPAQQATMWALMSFADNDSGECWPSMAKLAGRIGIHRGNAQIHVAALIERGVIGRTMRPGKATVYRFPVHPAFAAEPAEVVHTSRDSTRPELSTPRVIPRATPRDITRPPRVISRDRTNQGTNSRTARAHTPAVDNSLVAVADSLDSCAHCDGDGWNTRHDGERRWAERCTHCNAACWPVAR